MYTSFKRHLHLTHRWLGIALCLPMLLWFISGLVMLYVPRPELSAQEKLRLSAPLAAASVRLGAWPAWQQLARPGQPEAICLDAPRSDARPRYHFLSQGKWRSVHADDGTPLPPLDAAAAAAHMAGLVRADAQSLTPPPTPVQVELIDTDQWTLGRHFDPWRPFYRVEFDTGQAWYLSRDNHEVVLDTTTGERAWNWLGSVIHWVYFTPLRQQAGLWRQLILWLSALAMLMVVAGFWLGWQRLSWRKQFRHARHSPYPRSSQRWHHLWGLACGLLCVSWLLSGWLSLGPLQLTAGSGGPAARKHLQAGSWTASQLQARPDIAGSRQDIRQITWQQLADEPYWRHQDAQGRQWLVSPDAAAASASQPVDQAQLLARLSAVLQDLHPGAHMRLDTLYHADERYYSRRHQACVFPVWRLSFDDAAQHRYYLDPDTGLLLLSAERGDWVRRWLYLGLHRLDFPPLHTQPLARDVLVILLSLAGIIISATGCLLGWRRLRRRPVQTPPRAP